MTKSANRRTPDGEVFALGAVTDEGDDESLKIKDGAFFTRAPQNFSGSGSIKEIQTPTTTAASTTLFFPNGLNGVKVKFKRKNLATTPLAGRCYIAFNNTQFNDIAVADLRHTMFLGEAENFTFSGSNLPTEMTVITDIADTALGDSLIIITGGQKP